MGTKTIKVCDRCGAQHEQMPGNRHSVQQVKIEIPYGPTLSGGTFTRTKDLCEPCRVGLMELNRDYLEEKK